MEIGIEIEIGDSEQPEVSPLNSQLSDCFFVHSLFTDDVRDLSSIIVITIVYKNWRKFLHKTFFACDDAETETETSDIITYVLYLYIGFLDILLSYTYIY